MAHKANLGKAGTRKEGSASRRWVLVGAYAPLLVYVFLMGYYVAGLTHGGALL